MSRRRRAERTKRQRENRVSKSRNRNIKPINKAAFLGPEKSKKRTYKV